MTDAERIKRESTAHRLGELIAQDVHWMAQRFDVGGPDTDPQLLSLIDNAPMRYANTRYTRLLKAMADQLITSLEDEVGAHIQ